MSGITWTCTNGEEWSIQTWDLPNRKRPLLVVGRGSNVRKVGEVTDEELLSRAFHALVTGEVEH